MEHQWQSSNMTIDKTRANIFFEFPSLKEIRQGLAQRNRHLINQKMLEKEKQEYKYRIVKA